jgi:hypothetical protein
MKRRFLAGCVAAVVGTLALAAAGCGGSSKSSSPPTTAGVTTTAPATTIATTAPTSTTASGGSGFASAGNCRQLADVASKLGTAFSGKANLSATIKFFQDLSSKAPAEIRPDFAVLADAFRKIGAATQGLKPGQTPTSAQIAKLQALQGRLDVAKLTAAANHLSAWSTKNCHA